MASDAKAALATIRQCVEEHRIVLLPHFRQRLAERYLLWVDILSILEAPDDVRDEGVDDYGRSKWIVAGEGADGLPVESVCVFDVEDSEEITVFFTIY